MPYPKRSGNATMHEDAGEEYLAGPDRLFRMYGAPLLHALAARDYATFLTTRLRRGTTPRCRQQTRKSPGSDDPPQPEASFARKPLGFVRADEDVNSADEHELG